MDSCRLKIFPKAVPRRCSVKKVFLKISQDYRKKNVAESVFQESCRPRLFFNYMFKVSNRNTRTRCEICSKLTIKFTFYIYELSKYEITRINDFPHF